MCCFSGKVEHVSTTRIFARHLENGHQGLVYQMKVKAKQPVAMILPIPVATPASEASLKFHDFSEYKNFFVRLDLVFPKPATKRSKRIPAKKSAAAPLQVHQVGSFEASFVPTVNDFSRLDKRFRMPQGAWGSLPQYKDYGFAVFQFKLSKSGENSSHPMAFEFTSRDPQKLFFPTVHVHDGKVKETATFDHVLYCQGDKKSYQKKPKDQSGHITFDVLRKPVARVLTKKVRATPFRKFTGSSLEALVDFQEAHGFIRGTLPAHKLALKGTKTNADLWVSFVPVAAPKKIVAKKTKVSVKKAAPKKSAKKAPAKKMAKASTKRRSPLPKS
jgi:hypothetical protein